MKQQKVYLQEHCMNERSHIQNSTILTQKWQSFVIPSKAAWQKRAHNSNKSYEDLTLRV